MAKKNIYLNKQVNQEIDYLKHLKKKDRNIYLKSKNFENSKLYYELGESLYKVNKIAKNKEIENHKNAYLIKNPLVKLVGKDKNEIHKFDTGGMGKYYTIGNYGFHNILDYGEFNQLINENTPKYKNKNTNKINQEYNNQVNIVNNNLIKKFKNNNFKFGGFTNYGNNVIILTSYNDKKILKIDKMPKYIKVELNKLKLINNKKEKIDIENQQKSIKAFEIAKKRLNIKSISKIPQKSTKKPLNQKDLILLKKISPFIPKSDKYYDDDLILETNHNVRKNYLNTINDFSKRLKNNEILK